MVTCLVMKFVQSRKLLNGRLRGPLVALNKFHKKESGHLGFFVMNPASLSVHEFTTFPEAAMSCIAILNSLCYYNSSLRHFLAEQQNVLIYILRAILLFPNEEKFVVSASQLLCLLIFSHFTINSFTLNDDNNSNKTNITMPYVITNKTNFPFVCNSHSKISPYRKNNIEEWTMQKPYLSSFLRIHWSVAWFKGVKNVLKWPYVPQTADSKDYSKQLNMSDDDLTLIKTTSPIQGCIGALYEIQNATSHRSVNRAIDVLEGYIQLAYESKYDFHEFDYLPWRNTLNRFLTTPPGSPKDAELLLNFVKFLKVYVNISRNNRSRDLASWIVEPILEVSRGVMLVLKSTTDDTFNDDTMTTHRLKDELCQLISQCCSLTMESNCDWNSVMVHLIDCYVSIEIKNINSLAYADQIIGCLAHLTTSVQVFDQERLLQLMTSLISLCNALNIRKYRMEYKGISVLINSLIVLCHLIENVTSGDLKLYRSLLFDDREESLLSICIVFQDSPHTCLKILSMKLLSGLVKSDCAVMYMENECAVLPKILRIGISSLADLQEATYVREQAGILICNLLNTLFLLSKERKHLTSKSEFRDLITSLFHSSIVNTVSEICKNKKRQINIGDNIPLEYLLNKERYEVAHSKSKIEQIPLKLNKPNVPEYSIRLVTIIIDVVYNLLKVFDDIVDDMHKNDVFRMIFKCITLVTNSIDDSVKMYISVCRTLCLAINISGDVHATLADTKDCLSSLLQLVIANERFFEANVAHFLTMKKWCCLLIGDLLETQIGFKSLWGLLSEDGMIPFLYTLLFFMGDRENKDLVNSSLHCFTNLLNSYSMYGVELNYVNLEDMLDRYIDFNSIKDIELHCHKSNKNAKEKTSGDYSRTFSNGFVLSEKFCNQLIVLYKKNNQTEINTRANSENFDTVSSALCNLLGISFKAKMITVDEEFLHMIIGNLAEIHYYLTMTNEQINIIKQNKFSPIIHYLNWCILILGNAISNCDAAKVLSVEFNLINSLNKLWPWLILNGILRLNTLQLLCSYTNNSVRASQSMCVSIGARSVLNDIIELVSKEMGQISKKHSLTTLIRCLQILQNVSAHIHCRSIIIKSDILSCLNKLHPAVTKRQLQWCKVEILWEEFLDTITKYPEGQIKVVEYLGTLCALIHQADGLMLSVLRNCTFNSFNRPKILGSAEVVHIFSKILTHPQHPLPHKMAVAGALWAICANSQKSKLAVKNLGLTAKLAECSRQLKNDTYDKSNERELHIIDYILKILMVS